MNTNFTTKVALIAGAAIVLSACSSGNSGGSGSGSGDETTVTETVTETAAPVLQSGFAFPDVQLVDGDSVGTVTVPGGDLPVFSARRTLSAGTGDVVAFGDPVQLKYSMYSWTSGALVESTNDFDEAIIINAGVTQGVPAFLSSTVLGRNKGETVQIVYEAGMDDLPAYLDQEDAYVMVLQVL